LKANPIWLTWTKAALSMLFWALTFVWIKIALRTYRPYEIVFLRLVLASVLIFGVIFLFRQREKVQRKDMLTLLLVAFFEPFLYFLGESNGMQYVSSTLGSLIISTIPIVAAFGAWLFLKEKLNPWLFAGLVVSFGGVALLSISEPDLSGTLKGILLMLVAVFAGMFYAITVRRMTLKYRSLTIVAWQSLFGMLLMLPLFLIFDWHHFISTKPDPTGLLTIAMMSIFASVGAFLLYTGVIRELGVIRSNIFVNLIPVFTVFLAFFILGDKITLQVTGGVALTVIGLFLSQLPDLRRLHQRVMGTKT
jgi:drug/metabolite transporter (DMT)-like permease